jgi:4-nitrophenol 2-monooxygenase / 4-nitrocatechol 4-monooxygenase, reductase component
VTQTALTSDEFRNVMGQFASGVTVVTTVDDDNRFATTASAVSSLSLEPPMLLTCLNSSSATGRAIASRGRFAVNILGEDHSDLAVRFATRNIDKFQGVETVDGLDGLPLLADAIATLECQVSETTRGGTHYVFLAEVRRARGSVGAPLAYFRGQFGRLELAGDAAAAEAIRERVLHRRIPIGEPLNLDVLADETKAPRGSVYHALSNLVDKGWVMREPDGAFVVPPVTRETLIASARARLGIFVGAALTGQATAPEELVDRLRHAVRTLEPHEDGPIQADRWFADRTAMIEALMGTTQSGNVLLDAFNRADVPAQIHGFLFGERSVNASEFGAIHAGYAAIVDACAQGDHVALVGAIRALVRYYDQLYERRDS